MEGAGVCNPSRGNLKSPPRLGAAGVLPEDELLGYWVEVEPATCTGFTAGTVDFREKKPKTIVIVRKSR